MQAMQLPGGGGGGGLLGLGMGWMEKRRQTPKYSPRGA